MSALTRTVVILIVAMLPAASSGIQLTVPLVNQAPSIDGTVSAAEQSVSEELQLTRIGGLERPRFATRVFVSATLEGIYVGFIADEPSLDTLNISTTEENGAVFDDDSVQVFITPTLDTAADSYYHFAVNPDGTRYSNHLLSGDHVSNWKSAVSKSGNAWQAEFFIPLEAINAPWELPHWRANFARNRTARNDQESEISAWVNPGISLHNYKKFGYLTMPRFVGPAPTAGSEYTTTPVEIVTTQTVARSTDTTGPTRETSAP